MASTGSAVGDWQPTVKYLLVLIVAEILIMGIVRSMTKHGG